MYIRESIAKESQSLQKGSMSGSTFMFRHSHIELVVGQPLGLASPPLLCREVDPQLKTTQIGHKVRLWQLTQALRTSQFERRTT